MIDERTPILVGCAQFVQKGYPGEAQGLAPLLADASRRAADDAGDEAAVLQAIDTITVIPSTVQESGFERLPVGRLYNAPKTLAKALEIAPTHQMTTSTGGNTPQMLVNKFAEDIAEGRREAVLVAGGEVLSSMVKRMRLGEDMSHWGDGEEPISAEDTIGADRESVSDTERAHGLSYPANTYPMFENALRHHYGRTIEDHQQKLGEMMSAFTKVAAGNPYAWFPIERRPEEIAIESPSNRMVGFPYTKFLNSIMQVDQGGAFIMMSVGKAKALGVDPSRWVFIHGCADLNDIWNVSERIDFHSSPAIRLAAKKAFAMAGWTMDEIDYLDLYSCFPAVLQIACDELGLAHDDPRGLTVTGGLPYFGGAGNCYVICSIAEMMTRLRAKPGSRGFVTGNGWYVTKHSIGLYSTDPFEGPWVREDPKVSQSEIDAHTHPVADDSPQGRGTVEAYTIIHGREKVRMGIVLGSLESGKRFVAHMPPEEELLLGWEQSELIGKVGTVTPGAPTNLFIPD